MVEDTKENPPPQRQDSEAEKKPVAAPVPSARPAAPVQIVPPPRPASILPRPAVPPPPSQAPRGAGRRTFIKALVAISAILAAVPFVPWGNFLLSSVSSTGAAKRQPAVLDLNTSTNKNANGSAAGKQVNVNDLSTFPPNGRWLITYPTSGDIAVDSQNPDTFQKYQLVRLPIELGGADKSAASFVAFSKVCVHLWCSPNYNSTQTRNPSEFGYQAPTANVTTHQQYECPCHGSIYEIPDGKAVAGPASLQAFPTNAIPMLTLTADPNGNLFIEPPIADAEHNGVLGYGRDYASYENYILPVAQGKMNP